MADRAPLEDVDVVVRRSGRKRRAAWRETLEMSIRTSRSKGDSEKIVVKNLGGRPTHKKTAIQLQLQLASQLLHV